MSNYYEVVLLPQGCFDYGSNDYDPVAIVKLKSITQVAKFLETVDFHYLTPFVYTPKNNMLDAKEILKLWRY